MIIRIIDSDNMQLNIKYGTTEITKSSTDKYKVGRILTEVELKILMSTPGVIIGTDYPL